MAEAAHILVVDDDARLRDLLSQFLARNGFRVSTASDAAAADAMLQSLAFDLLVLDVMMPGEDGRAFAARLRETSQVPILLLTAMGEKQDRIAGLSAGVDDYLVKPFEPDELLLRIRAILRRAPPPRPVAAAPVRFGEFVFDPVREELTQAGLPVHLTSAEVSLLRLFAEAGGAAITRDDLLARSRLSGGARTVDVQVTRLRRKIEVDPKAPRFLLTVRGEGYRLRLD
ncbi:MAG: response regulator transcription factor [Alphaproteobacteria bacterium]|nr:response regulator transcription factor [Alphaproteobacteria bacterium]